MKAAGVTTHENALARAIELAKRTGGTTLENKVKEKLTSENLYHLNGLTERMKNMFRLHHPAYKKDDLEIKTEKELEVGKEYAGVTDKISLLRKYFEIAAIKKDDTFLEKVELGDELLYENLIKQVYDVEKEVKNYETQGQYDTALKDLQGILEMHPDKERIENKIAQVQNKRKLKDEFERYFVRGSEYCTEIIEEKDYHERLNKFDKIALRCGFRPIDIGKKDYNPIVYAKGIGKKITQARWRDGRMEYSLKILAFNGNRIIHQLTDLGLGSDYSYHAKSERIGDFNEWYTYEADSDKVTIDGPGCFKGRTRKRTYWFDN